MKKKNKYRGNFEQEKLRLRVKQLELEKQIRNDWNDLKSGFSIDNLFGKGSSSHHSKKENGLFEEAINYSVDYLTTKVSDIAGEKISTGIKKGIDKLRTVFKK